ncbi:hypothetical protein [Cellulomonas aerilata]|uniref:Uncharacterized protein n=1 Tax=Cellulomonas aerilata TaxID=515326 RepID=A0A512D7E7_9CELL|nr:hypothetical protein [Cellulomonas aerilata]GEO32408.1 hypothetical protein CAE01nite_01330 [Cellulomonas aerilata]
MSWNRRRRVAAGVAAGGVALLAAAVVPGGGPLRACSAVGFADVAPIELRFDPALGVDSVAACLGAPCRPVALADAGGGWAVPQTREYLQAVEPGAVTHVTVRATAAGVVVVDRVAEVGRADDGGSGWPECPGPYRFLPVTIDA